MANEVKHLQMTDGTIVDINTYIDLNGFIITSTDRHSVPGIIDALNQLVLDGITNHTVFITNYRYRRIDSSGIDIDCTPVSVIVTQRYIQIGDQDNKLWSLIAPTFTIDVWDDNTVTSDICTNTELDDYFIFPSNVTPSSSNYPIYERCLSENKKPTWYNNNTKYMHLPVGMLIAPPSGAPLPITSRDAIKRSLSTTTGNFTIYFYYSVNGTLDKAIWFQITYGHITAMSVAT